MELVNRTPFWMDRTVLLDKKGGEFLVVGLKATFSIGEDGSLAPAQEQEPIKPADEFWGEPDQTSIRQEAELGPAKLATDVFLFGSAVSPRPGTREMQVAFRVGPVGVQAVVSGERFWRDKVTGAAMSDPEPFESIPLVWERAFGGTDLTPEKEEHWAHEPRNPVGVGFRAHKSLMEWIDTPLPNIEHPSDRMGGLGDRVAPVGFGPIGRNWEPRIRYVGTYDKKWMEERMPLLPEDFDERHHNAAPPELLVPGYLEGFETVEVYGCTRNGWLTFPLPGLRPEVSVRVAREERAVLMPLNTVAVDTDRMQLRLLWKGSLGVHGEVMEVSHIEAHPGGAP